MHTVLVPSRARMGTCHVVTLNTTGYYMFVGDIHGLTVLPLTLKPEINLLLVKHLGIWARLGLYGARCSGEWNCETRSSSTRPLELATVAPSSTDLVVRHIPASGPLHGRISLPHAPNPPPPPTPSIERQLQIHDALGFFVSSKAPAHAKRADHSN